MSTLTSWLIGIGWASARSRARISRQFRRQQVAGIHRQQLPDFHRRAAQLGQLIGDAAGIGRRQQQVAHAWPFALGELAHALGQHAAGNAGGQTAQPGQP